MRLKLKGQGRERKFKAALLFFFLMVIATPAYCKYHNGLKVSTNGSRQLAAGMFISRPDPCSEALYRDIVLENMSSLNDYALWLKSNFTYKKDADGFDVWAKPRQTLLKGGGDCEDLAFLNKAALLMLGYEAEVLAVMRSSQGHALCVFKEGSFYYVTDNTKIIKTNISERPELLKALAKAYKGTHIVAMDINSREGNIIFKTANLAGDGF